MCGTFVNFLIEEKVGAKFGIYDLKWLGGGNGGRFIQNLVIIKQGWQYPWVAKRLKKTQKAKEWMIIQQKKRTKWVIKQMFI